MVVALALAVTGVALGTGSAAAQPTAIDSCTVISEPGKYALTQDVASSGEGTCIDIRSSDVVFDGNGHAIEGQGDGTGIGTSGAESVRNVTVADLTVRAHVINVEFDGVTDGQLTNVTSQEPDMVGGGVVVTESAQIEVRNSQLDGASLGGTAVKLRDAAEVTLANNSFTAGSTAIDADRLNESGVSENDFADIAHPIQIDDGSENEIANNTFDGRSEVAIDVAGSDNAVRDNTISLATNGIQVAGSANTISNNDVSRVEGWATSIEGDDHTVVRNDLSGGEGVSESGGALEVQGTDHTVTANTLGGVHGVYVRNVSGSVNVVNNDVDATYQVRVAETERCVLGPEGAAAVVVRANTFTVDESDTDYYGVLNEDDETLDARNNYWGAESGPSSPGNDTVSDPVTGAPADGSGAPVSTGVRFDPWHSNESGA